VSSNYLSLRYLAVWLAEPAVRMRLMVVLVGHLQCPIQAWRWEHSVSASVLSQYLNSRKFFLFNGIILVLRFQLKCVQIVTTNWNSSTTYFLQVFCMCFYAFFVLRHLFFSVSVIVVCRVFTMNFFVINLFFDLINVICECFWCAKSLLLCS
jgi:hypothetical protein